jgi:signal transduction histidine kinase
VWGEEEGVLLILNDVSLKIMNEKLREIERFKDKMLSTVTHDLKTPLNSIIMILENSVEVGEINDKQRKIVL